MGRSGFYFRPNKSENLAFEQKQSGTSCVKTSVAYLYPDRMYPNKNQILDPNSALSFCFVL
jgi:hypothetical protein